MNSESKICQNCSKEFAIELEDFVFYKKIDVPPPTFCPECRFQRRLMFRNERALYKDKCDLCGKDMISVFSPEKPFKVFCSPCWWSDNWDPLESGRDYDPNRNFFEQMKEVMLKSPFMNLIVGYSTMINSDFCNHASSLKNCYLMYNGDFDENVHYSEVVVQNKDMMDSTMVGESELCYGVINGTKLHKVFFSEDIRECHNVYFSKNMVGCSDCFGCINLKNKKYHIFNEGFSKEDYEKKLSEFNIDSYTKLQEVKDKAYSFWKKIPQKYMHERYNENVSGDYVYESKNAKNMYVVRYVEDGKFGQLITTSSVKDIYDYTEWGASAQRIIDTITAGQQADLIKYSSAIWDGVMNIEYSMYVISGSNNFGCVNLRNKNHCILNKQYTKEEYEKLRAQIIADMEKNPYVDSKGRIFKYGEFLPYDLSPYDYNESTASWYYPLEKKTILENGWRWHDSEPAEYKVTMGADKIPDSIREVKDDIINEVLECVDCNKVYRIISAELDLLRRFALPLPRKCPNCRYKERHSRLNPPKLWKRSCAKCGKEIETSFAPERPEIIYCGECYQTEFI